MGPIIELQVIGILMDAAGNVLIGDKTKKIAQGNVNFWGGKIKPGQSVENAIVEEALEEIGVTIQPYNASAGRRGVLFTHSYDSNGNPHLFKVFLSVITSWEGTPQEQKESGLTNLRWVHKDAVPYARMLPGDEYWLREVLRSKFVEAEVWYKPGMGELEKQPVVTLIDLHRLNHLWQLP